MRNRFTSLVLGVILAVSLLGPEILPVQAGLVKATFEGTVTDDNGGNNPFGLFGGDTISGWAIFDDTVPASSGGVNLTVFDQVGWDFGMTLGSYTFGQTDVNDSTYTNFWFVDGKLDGIEFFKEAFNIGIYLNLLLEDYNGGQSLFVEDFDTGNPIYLEADWDFAGAPAPNPVPVPGTLLLLGTGLLGLVRLRNKK